MGQKIGRYISIVILVLSSALGVWNGLSDWEIDRTALQASVTVGVLLHSLVGFGAAATLIRKAPAARWLTLFWTVIVAYVSSTASIAYAGDDATVAGAVAAGLGSALIGLAINWCARVVTQEPNVAVGQRAEVAS